MHTRRMATFLLGAWLGCSILVGLLVLTNQSSPANLLVTPSAPAAALIDKLGREDTLLILNYHAAEQNRRYLYTWETAQLAIALALGLCLFFGTQRSVFAMILCGMMVAFLLIQHFGLTPEYIFRGREADFPPGSQTFGVQARVWSIGQLYVIMEGAKLLTGGVLASYLFVFRTGRRVRKKVDLVDHANHSHVDR
jgi:hypothetical protein